MIVLSAIEALKRNIAIKLIFLHAFNKNILIKMITDHRDILAIKSVQ
jgi:hypothetical protein